MTFQEAIKTCFKKYADFNGRASRSEYWWFMLFYLTSLLAFLFIAFIINNYILFLFLGMIVPLFAVASRRLHDTNRSGWWQLIRIIPGISLIFIYFLVLKGQADYNQYGPPPAN